MKQKLLFLLVLLLTATTGAWATDYNITLPTVSNGSVVAKVSDVSVTSAAAGATVTLEATPDAGYKLKTISGVYSGTVSETISKGAATKTGTYFRVSGSHHPTYGWKIGSGDHYTLTISSLSNQNLSQVVLTVGTAPNVSQRNISHLQADHGTLSATGTAQSSTVTITGINSPTLVVSAPGSGNATSMWTFTQAKIDGLGNVALTLTDTGDDNVKTFTMPSGNVTVSAEFEEIPFVAVTGVTLSQTSASLTAGGAALELTPTVAPEGATDKTVKWSVKQTGDFVALYTDEACTQAVGTDAIAAAKVYVKPLAAGQATITVTTNDGAKTATCAVTIAEPTFNVTLQEGTEDADKWDISPAEATAGSPVTATYNGTKKVKSVKAVKKGGAEPVDNTYLKWDADQKKLVATDIPAEVTTVENANQNIEWAGTYVVEGDVTISGIIKLNGNVELIIKDGAKLTVTNNQIVGYDKNLSIYGQANQTGQLVVNYSENAITNINTLEVHSCQVKATSSGNSYSGFNNIQTFNVYGGSVDAESTAANGGYGISMYSSGSMYIYGGDVKALGKGNKFGIRGSDSTITVYGGKLWAGCFNNKAIDASNVTLTKGAGFTGKIEISGSGESWSEWTVPATPGTNYVRVGY